MKSKKYRKHLQITSVMMIVLLIMSFISVQTIAANDDSANRMNVVFVLDQSGSMNTTDASQLRYEAMDLFMGISSDTGNYMGAVIFNDRIVSQLNITAMNGSSDKNAMSQQVRATAGQTGWTDIGTAIKTATDMLDSNKNPSLDSAIILLTDGNTVFTDKANDPVAEEKMAASEKNKKDAIQVAQQNGYKIYSICLNADGSANLDEMKMISEQTNGTFVEVKNANDLKNVFTQFYGMIYSTDTTILADTTIPQTGILEIPFNIPRIGVDEANIVINTLNTGTKYSLYDPNNSQIPDSTLDSVSIKAKTFTIIKLSNPDDGRWKLVVNGISGDQVRIDMVYNSELAIEADVEVKGKEASIAARITNHGTPIADTTVYDDYPLQIDIVNTTKLSKQTDTMKRLPSSDANGNAMEYMFEKPDTSEYEATIYVNIDGYSLKSMPIALNNANNTAPKVKKSYVEYKKFVIPFCKNEKKLNLSAYFSDNENDELTYSIKRQPANVKDLRIEDENVIIPMTQFENGTSFTIVASDGALETEMLVKVISINIMVIVLIVLLATSIILVVVIVIKNKGEQKIRIDGRVQICAYDGNSSICAPETTDGHKGKNYLRGMIDISGNDVSIDFKNTYLIGDPKTKNRIYLVSKKGYFTSEGQKARNKKITIYANQDVEVSDSNSMERRIIIVYIPNEDDMDYGSF